MILIIGCLALLFNVLLGLLLSHYAYFNMGVNCGVIALNTALLFFCIYIQFARRFPYIIQFSICATEHY